MNVKLDTNHEYGLRFPEQAHNQINGGAAEGFPAWLPVKF